ncbi:MAG: glycosyltransferase family 2 protein [Patescibacteria group bacterium]
MNKKIYDQIYPKVSVIVPCYNERERILPVLESIKKSSYVEEIIVVDDSSEEKTIQLLRSLKNITLITLKENKGKALALKIGVLNAHTDTVMFVDSDLKNLTPENIDQMVEAFFDGGYDMVIGEREREWIFARYTGMATTLAGERIIKKQLLLDHMELFKAEGYLIESAINKLFFKQKKVGRVLLYGVGQFWKEQKSGIGAVFLKDIPWMIRYIRFLGIKDFLGQLYFAKKLPFIPSSRK